jgi:hypothetical protein
MTLQVERAVEVVACVNVPVSIAPWNHDEELALARTPRPQRQPQVGTFPDRNGVTVLARYWPQLHQADFRSGRAMFHAFIEDASLLRQFLRRNRCRVNGLILQPPLECLEIVFADELNHVPLLDQQLRTTVPCLQRLRLTRRERYV